MISLLTVSDSLLVFSAPVFWTAGGEGDIADWSTGASPQFDDGGGPATSVPISSWFNGPPPPVDDPWAMVGPLTVITPAPPATGFSNSAGLVTA